MEVEITYDDLDAAIEDMDDKLYEILSKMVVRITEITEVDPEEYNFEDLISDTIVDMKATIEDTVSENRPGYVEIEPEDDGWRD